MEYSCMVCNKGQWGEIARSTKRGLEIKGQQLPPREHSVEGNNYAEPWFVEDWWDRSCACVADRPAKLEEGTYKLVRIIEATLTPCRDVKGRRNRETLKRKGIRTRGFLKPGVKSDKKRGKQWINRKEMRSRRWSGAEGRHGGYAGRRCGRSDSQAWERGSFEMWSSLNTENNGMANLGEPVTPPNGKEMWK